MSTVNGFGTRYYGWGHCQDGTSTATKWITAFYVPVVPLERHSLKVVTDFDNDPVHVEPIAGGAFGISASQLDHYAILGKTQLIAFEILVTYVKAYVLLPILMVLPLALVILFSKTFGTFPDSPAAKLIAATASVLTLFSALGWPVWAIRRSRGKV